LHKILLHIFAAVSAVTVLVVSMPLWRRDNCKTCYGVQKHFTAYTP